MSYLITQVFARNYQDSDGCWAVPCATKQAAHECILASMEEFLLGIDEDDHADLIEAVNAKDFHRALDLWNTYELIPSYEIDECEVHHLKSSQFKPKIMVKQDTDFVKSIDSIGRSSQMLILLVRCSDDILSFSDAFEDSQVILSLNNDEPSVKSATIKINLGYGWIIRPITNSRTPKELTVVCYRAINGEHVELWPHPNPQQL